MHDRSILRPKAVSQYFDHLRRLWPATEPVFRWSILTLLGTALLGALLYAKLLNPVDPFVETDTSIYRNAGEAILAGQVPYRDFLIEYPPGALPAFVLPALFSSSPAGYNTLFAAEMALLLVATMFLTAAASQRFGKPWLLPALTIGAGALLLLPFTNSRYDVVIAFALAGAVWGTAACRCTIAWMFLGFGTLAKLVPVLATAALYPLRQGRLRGSLTFIGILLAGFIPAFLASPAGFWNIFSYHAYRGLQIESFAASVLFKLNWVEGIADRYGALEAVGGLAEVAATATLPVTLALLSTTCAVIWLEARRGRLRPDQFPRYAAALLLAFMVGSKVLSPQYLLWLLPLVPLAFRGVWNVGVSVVFLLACWLTIRVFSTFYGYENPILLAALISVIYTNHDVLDSQWYLSYVGSEPLNILLGRNILLLMLWFIMLVAPSRVSANAIGGNALGSEGITTVRNDLPAGELPDTNRIPAKSTTSRKLKKLRWLECWVVRPRLLR